MQGFKMCKLSFFVLFCTFLLCEADTPDISVLSLDEKIGQLFMVATVADPDNPLSKDILFGRSIRNVPSIKNEDELRVLIKDYHIGGIIFLGNSTTEKQYAMTLRLRSYNKKYNNIPLLFGLDAEWGPNMRLTDAIKFPFNIALGALKDKALIREIAYEEGCCLQSLNIDINFAPVADCNTNAENPVINRRSFGQDPQEVSACVHHAIIGFHQVGILTCVKHFPGHGNTATDSHTGLPLVKHTEEQLQHLELIPFQKAVHENTDALMTAHILLPALDNEKPATLSPLIIKKIIRETYHFNGLVVTDALDMEAITCCYSPAHSALLALQADCDLLIAPVDVPEICKAIKEAITNKKITIAELDMHVQRILKAKQKLSQKTASTKEPRKIVCNERLEKLSKKAYQDSITLIQNIGILPLCDRTKEVVIIDLGTQQESICTQIIKQKHPSCKTYLQASINNSLDNMPELHNADLVIITMQGLTYTKPDYGISNETMQLITR
jgi:beta-N-acetylhexosaminidase